MSDASLQPILALVGAPVAGNPTQFMMEKAFAQANLDCRFLTLEVTPADLGDAIRGMRAMNFLGGICADPHKQLVVEHLPRTTGATALIGVVNCLFRDGADLIGENTEGQGLLQVLRPTIDPAGKRIVLLGAGHVARAIAVELALCKPAEIVVLDRTESRAAELVALLHDKLQAPASAGTWQKHYPLPPDTALLVNATTIGQEDDETLVPVDLATFNSAVVVADVTFNPPRTRLLSEASQLGCTTLDGLEMFVAQAAICFSRWTGVEPDRTVMREAVEEFLLL